MDIISVSALVIAIIGALGHFVKELHIKNCHSFLCDSDCTKTPNNSESDLRSEIKSTKV